MTWVDRGCQCCDDLATLLATDQAACAISVHDNGESNQGFDTFSIETETSRSQARLCTETCGSTTSPDTDRLVVRTITLPVFRRGLYEPRRGRRPYWRLHDRHVTQEPCLQRSAAAMRQCAGMSLVAGLSLTE